jgi:hypothetical protein
MILTDPQSMRHLPRSVHSLLCFLSLSLSCFLDFMVLLFLFLAAALSLCGVYCIADKKTKQHAPISSVDFCDTFFVFPEELVDTTTVGGTVHKEREEAAFVDRYVFRALRVFVYPRYRNRCLLLNRHPQAAIEERRGLLRSTITHTHTHTSPSTDDSFSLVAAL